MPLVWDDLKDSGKIKIATEAVTKLQSDLKAQWQKENTAWHELTQQLSRLRGEYAITEKQIRSKGDQHLAKKMHLQGIIDALTREQVLEAAGPAGKSTKATDDALASALTQMFLLNEVAPADEKAALSMPMERMRLLETREANAKAAAAATKQRLDACDHLLKNSAILLIYANKCMANDTPLTNAEKLIIGGDLGKRMAHDAKAGEQPVAAVIVNPNAAAARPVALSAAAGAGGGVVATAYSAQTQMSAHASGGPDKGAGGKPPSPSSGPA